MSDETIERIENRLEPDSVTTLLDVTFDSVFLKPRRPEFSDFDIKTLLSVSPGGASVITAYESKGILDNTQRNRLTDIIERHLYKRIVNK